MRIHSCIHRENEVKAAAVGNFLPSWTLTAFPPFEMNSPGEVDWRYKLIRDVACPRLHCINAPPIRRRAGCPNVA